MFSRTSAQQIQLPLQRHKETRDEALNHNKVKTRGTNSTAHIVLTKTVSCNVDYCFSSQRKKVPKQLGAVPSYQVFFPCSLAKQRATDKSYECVRPEGLALVTHLLI